jgi:Ca2+-binding EF-hand superfamily protein
MLAKRVFSSFDENGDKVITFREFVLALSVLCQKGATEDKVKRK